MIDWSAIDTVLLDMDGTLLDLHFDNFFWQEHVPLRYAQLNALEEAQSLADLMQRFDAEQGSLRWYSLDYWSEQLQMDLPALKRELAHMVRARPFVEHFLQRLHASHRQVYLVTNAHPKTLAIKMEAVDLSPWFDEVVVSHDLDVPKEDLRFWQLLQERHPFDPQRTLLIDDTETVLQAAHEYGIAHLLTLLQPDSSLQKRLDTTFPGIHHFDEIMPEEAVHD